MNEIDLSNVYRGYIACLNKQDWPHLGQFVHDDVYYNDR
jgi:predicted ester cyclase